MRRLRGGGPGPVDALTVRLRREFKGLTVAQLVTDLALSGRLPGQVRSALEQIDAGNLAAAERLLPGQFAAVLPGPGHRRGRRWARAWLLLSCGALAAAVGVARMM